MLRGLVRTLHRGLERRRIRRDAEILKASELFDGDWYLKQYPDVHDSGMDPAEHYIRFGWRDGREPSPFFRSNVYLALNPAARRAGISPLHHYLRSAKAQRPNARVEADLAFLHKISADAGPAQVHHEPPAAAARWAERSAGGAPAVSPDAAPLNIVLINYGPFDNNSGMHVCSFANALSAMGHRIVVSAVGASGHQGDIEASSFLAIPQRRVRENPEILGEFFSGCGKGTPDLIHCWTPRRINWSIVRAVIAKYHCPYVIHFEDNEMAVARAYGSLGEPHAKDKATTAAVGRLPPGIADFVAGAAGATVIVDALRDVLPQGVPVHLLQPGVDADLFAPGIDAAERARLLAALDIPADARIIVYPGNVHPANAEDVFSLYAAIHALNALGHKVHLIRTGEDNVPVVHPRFAKLARQHVTNLGVVRRERLIKILKLADFFVQPGGPDEFNSYRLPSKLPEFFAMGRPVVLANTNIGLSMTDGVNAILMQRGDAAEITRCVETLMNDPALAERVGREGRRFAIEHFNWNRSAAQLAAFYRRLLRR